MARDLDEKVEAVLKHGETSQALSLSDIFTLKDGSVTPVLMVTIAEAVSCVLYLSPQYSVPISLLMLSNSHVFCSAIWLQNSTVFHFSMFYAPHHITPVPATESQIKAEAAAVRTAVETFCPFQIVLDRVVLTSTGVLLGCWQVSHSLILLTLGPWSLLLA
ncbi:unnamed protein product [Linum tenue]|uniref:Uncharacterized protein n=1 Tax=Linum tenue TaxID=586396 RepID=A0AAV0IPR2_9ROSI|nr:unnamed protein product [Linum tenue]